MGILENYMHYAIVHNCKHGQSLPYKLNRYSSWQHTDWVTMAITKEKTMASFTIFKCTLNLPFSFN